MHAYEFPRLLGRSLSAPEHERASGSSRAGEIDAGGCRLVGNQKLELKQLHKLNDRKPRLPDDGPQGAPIYLLVIRNNNLGKGIISPQDRMAALTPLDIESRVLQNLKCTLCLR